MGLVAKYCLSMEKDWAQITGTYTTGQELPVVDPNLFKVSEGPAHPVLEIRGGPGVENYFSHFSALSVSRENNLLSSSYIPFGMSGTLLAVPGSSQKTGDDLVTHHSIYGNLMADSNYRLLFSFSAT